MRVAVYSLGCKVNIYESEYVINLLKNHDYQIVDFDDVADIYIINTCSVTNESDKKSRKIINQAKRKNKDAIIVVMGCYSQIRSGEVDTDIVIGNKDKSHILDIIDEYLNNHKQIKRVYDLSNQEFEDMTITNFENHTRAFVKIQDGCNAYCSYCVIPYTRGGLRSKKMDKVIEEVSLLVKNGYKEIVLTGIHTGRYGIDINTNLETLLDELVKIEGLYRIRLSSIEINELTPHIIELISTNDKIAKHLHVPIQSGSDKILKSMNRRYNKEEFINKINELKKIKDISLTTDLIVGFPGEGEEEFQETMDTLKEIGFTKIHTFPYSRRNGTPASTMSNQVEEPIKKKRVREVINLSNELENTYYNKFIGRVFDGLVEVRRDEKFVLTSNYISVVVNDDVQNNEIVNVMITKVDNDKVYGKIVK